MVLLKAVKHLHKVWVHFGCFRACSERSTAGHRVSHWAGYVAGPKAKTSLIIKAQTHNTQHTQGQKTRALAFSSLLVYRVLRFNYETDPAQLFVLPKLVVHLKKKEKPLGYVHSRVLGRILTGATHPIVCYRCVLFKYKQK